MTVRVMVDLETMATTADAAIVSIGAVSSTGQQFYTAVDLDQGRRIDPSTVYWWLRQSDAARSALSVDRIGLERALTLLSDWYRQIGVDEIWAMPAMFDISILEHAYKDCGFSVPWHYRTVRCLRTVAALVPNVSKPEMRVGVAHNALSDAQVQMEWLNMLLSNGGV